MEVEVVEKERDAGELVRALEMARDPEDLAGLVGAIRRLVASLAGAGGDGVRVGRLASRLYDGLLVRAAWLARDGPKGEGGLPPGCALAVLGSQGRREQFLATDQDNALILGKEDDGAGEADRYAPFAARLSAILRAAGLPPCPKGIMAATPAWRKSVAAWRADIDVAAARPDAAAVLFVSLLADLRSVAGDPALVPAVARHLALRLAEAPLLTRGLAREALNFGPPRFFFGHLPVELFRFGAPLVDLKRAAVFPLTIGVKALALDAGLAATGATGTDERLAGLAERGVLGEGLAARLGAALSRIQSVRLLAQAEAFAHGRPPDNRVDLGRLDTDTVHGLREALHAIGELRAILEHHFGLRYLT
uniref:Putative signal-transduction protein containing cAMP-binding and CBS domains n=1 Tax=Desulfovibrio sp. U5L TaxID=596152 RepID=I2Q398_9BACT